MTVDLKRLIDYLIKDVGISKVKTSELLDINTKVLAKLEKSERVRAVIVFDEDMI